MLALLGLKGTDRCLDSLGPGAGTKVKVLLWFLIGIPEATITLATTPSAYSSGKTGWREIAGSKRDWAWADCPPW